MGHQQAPIVGAALVALRVAALRGFGPSQARPQHAPLVGAAFVVVLPSVAAPVALRYAALAGFGAYQARPQQTPLVGAALVALAGGGHQQALCGAALMTSVPQGYWSGWQDSGLVSRRCIECNRLGYKTTQPHHHITKEGNGNLFINRF